ncbi:8-oxo-dGTP pyrophosphatase MutT, NUDIX family [Palleronia salina]|uniref:8-oxo-dGTP pyrophosphatase MutT, NUDIX family n=1 Tax=Palleronia salina TaxID=313368 RepID=A0A1M6CSV6_9RHOB|nr:CoA pyrophosphatase [Palleronia salina]SHI63818.1 8-oxo-dGTP pyrophosphatase MutT, NUDIX family [Palleronia salina]
MDDLRARLLAALARDTGPSSDFDLNAPARPPAMGLRGAGVLVPVCVRTGSVILTKRSSQLSQHPGQIAFPGGKIDPGDRDATDAALREAEEEIGLPRDAVEIIGALPPHETVTGFAMHPVLGFITRPFEPRPEPGEVAEIFHVPFDHVTDPARFSVQSRRWRGQQRLYYTVPYGPYYIWGATARILRGLAQRVSA